MVDDMRELHESDACVPAVRHGGGAGMVLLTLEGESEGADAHDSSNYPQ